MRKQILLVVLFGLVLPVVLMAYLSYQASPGMQETQPTEGSEPLQAPSAGQEPEELLPVMDHTGQVSQMLWEEYLTGVVLAEMPADFHDEALKAQAVVARTYAMKRLLGGTKHDTAAICAQSGCCQGYVAREDYLAGGGTQEAVDKVAAAVRATAGQVLTYDGELIDATYFSCSGGTTEAAVEVWGTDVPYLQVTDSPGEEAAAHYADEVTFSAGELARKLELQPVGDPRDWFGAVSYTDGGGVDTIEICGRVFSGKELRTLLGLRSTAFSVSADGDSVTIATRGFGHRVGMSQYGALAMAQGGSLYPQILAHYYQGTELRTR